MTGDLDPDLAKLHPINDALWRQEAMKNLVVYVGMLFFSNLCLGSDKPFVIQAFRNAENTLIDILRLKEPTLDSRNIKFESTVDQGGFAVCCFTKKHVVVKNSKTEQILGQFSVVVGNHNYLDFEKGNVQTSVFTENKTHVVPHWICKDQATQLIGRLFPNSATIDEKFEPTQSFAASYTFEVKDNSKTIGEITLNAIECEIQSVTLNP